MPVIAIAGAIFAGATLATVGVAAMSTFAVISAVGAIAAGIGVITGDKTLTALGGIASLAGGIGAFAQNSGWIGASELASGADAAGNVTASAAPKAASGITDALAQQSQVVTDASAALADGTKVVDGAAMTGLSSETVASGASSPSNGLINASPTGVDAPYGYDHMNKSVDSLNALRAGPTSTSTSIMGVLKDVGGFMKDNKDIASLGMNFVGGLFDDKKAAEAKQAGAATALYDARTQNELLQGNILRQQTANANSVPDLTGLRIDPAIKVYNTGAPPIYTGPRVGLINSTGR